MTGKISTIIFIVLFYSCHSAALYAEPILTPEASINQLLDNLETYGKTGEHSSPDDVRQFITRQIRMFIALNEMTGWIAGPRSRAMSPQDKIDLKHRLEKVLENIISNNIGKLSTIRSRVSIDHTTYKTTGYAVVDASLVLLNNAHFKFKLHMKQLDSSWKVTDIKFNDTSALVYFRQYFASLLKSYSQPENQHQ